MENDKTKTPQIEVNPNEVAGGFKLIAEYWEYDPSDPRYTGKYANN